LSLFITLSKTVVSLSCKLSYTVEICPVQDSSVSAVCIIQSAFFKSSKFIFLLLVTVGIVCERAGKKVSHNRPRWPKGFQVG
jgi:hypothetical protein